MTKIWKNLPKFLYSNKKLIQNSGGFLKFLQTELALQNSQLAWFMYKESAKNAEWHILPTRNKLHYSVKLQNASYCNGRINLNVSSLAFWK